MKESEVDKITAELLKPLGGCPNGWGCSVALFDTVQMEGMAVRVVSWENLRRGDMYLYNGARLLVFPGGKFRWEATVASTDDVNDEWKQAIVIHDSGGNPLKTLPVKNPNFNIERGVMTCKARNGPKGFDWVETALDPSEEAYGSAHSALIIFKG